jgi:glucokinase
VNLYRAIVKSDGRLPENLQPKDVTSRALADSCIDCRRALSLFCVIMGRFGGNLALNLAPSVASISRAGSCHVSSTSLKPRFPRWV